MRRLLLAAPILACLTSFHYSAHAAGDAGAVTTPAVLDAGTATTLPAAPPVADDSVKDGSSNGGGTVAASDDATWENASRFVFAIRAGHWREVVALFLILVVGVLMRLGRKVPLIGKLIWDPQGNLKDLGGTIFLFGTTAAMSVGASLLGDVAIGWGLFRDSFNVSLLAAGGYSVLFKKVLVPLWSKIFSGKKDTE